MIPSDTLLMSFLRSKYFNLYEGYAYDILDILPALDAVIKSFTDNQFGREPWSDFEVLEAFYLQIFPDKSILLMHDAIYLHELMLDFYQFLFEKNIISLEIYQQFLVFVQKNKKEYLEEMQNPDRWSPEKRADLEKVYLFLKEDGKIPKKTVPDNVIPFPKHRIKK